MNKGFSLVELLVTIAILGVMASIAMPAFSEFIALTQVKTGASNLHLSLMRTRSEAIKRNTSATIAKTGAGWQEGWTITTGAETIENQGALKVEISGGQDSVIYNANGRASGANIEFKVESPNTTQTRCVAINLSGQPIVRECP